MSWGRSSSAREAARRGEGGPLMSRKVPWFFGALLLAGAVLFLAAGPGRAAPPGSYNPFTGFNPTFNTYRPPYTGSATYNYGYYPYPAGPSTYSPRSSYSNLDLWPVAPYNPDFY